MDISIIKGNMMHLDDCELALINSELGRTYFYKQGSARKALEEGLLKQEIYVAIDENQKCVGFVWFSFVGIFYSFPYLHIIAVKEENRNQGIGRKLISYFENICFENDDKLFLVVADFNTDAKRLYEKIGYVEVGSIPSLFKTGISEHLMMKNRNEELKTIK